MIRMKLESVKRRSYLVLMAAILRMNQSVNVLNTLVESKYHAGTSILKLTEATRRVLEVVAVDGNHMCKIIDDYFGVKGGTVRTANSLSTPSSAYSNAGAPSIQQCWCTFTPTASINTMGGLGSQEFTLLSYGTAAR
ncbi:hypothetical protein GCK32_017713 [Trichostrongylus colubriformis]|uniref:Uncharacterized protein n=1 Tax=Trichostrongylus colubriformis TaxID=6319 RepID=A0AAN8F3D2_TRICO